MKKNNLIRFVQSLVLLPTMTMSLTGIHSDIADNVLAQKVNTNPIQLIAFNQALNDKDVNKAEEDKNNLLKLEAVAIDAYFDKYDMPLSGTGLTMAKEADKNGLDWRLLAAIAVRESTGGKFDCKKVDNNPFGWGSCKIGFKSIEDAIATVAKNLGGNNPNTAHHYDNKSTMQILRAYNPPSVVPKYAEQVISIMNAIGNEDPATLLSV
jgi:hypothetical protein